MLDGRIPGGEAVLKDALMVLSSDDIKLASLRQKEDDHPVTDEDRAMAADTAIKKTLISQVFSVDKS